MSKYESLPHTHKSLCASCKYLDQSVILTTYPPQAFCTLFKKNVFVTNDKCLDDVKENDK